ncbi:hypothetical protein POJ06DRAFT_259510 [Lipomyces tetrasporus]|uniref:Ubiquitin carboxyl-terminal hydrolase n=1 Tax=Lipomyces tetrasporus TaxID=54092 RepID=A0AAD7QNQ5_9ASCO|nr:uncharacterized protein POJ06DRAFT_259510 [Lipomyces tetrasporus]KAJ8098448.1 hypothetical protein POJ06DRAFT_259510 [Lipomyces tetrasporus]
MAAAKIAPDFLNLWTSSSPLFLSDSHRWDRSCADHSAPPNVQPSATPAVADSVLGGLVNPGNACFLNSVLQAMASSESLTTFLDSPLSASLPLAHELRTLISHLNTRLPAQHTHTTVPLLKELKSNRWMDDSEQQDAHEFLLSLLDALRTERANSDNTILPLDGLLSSRVVCQKCGEEQTLKQIPFSSLELSVPSSSSSSSSPLFSRDSVTLDSMLANVVAPEKLEVYCQRCSLVAAEAHLQRLIAHASPPSSRSPSPEPELETKPKPDIAPILRARRSMIVSALEKPTIQDADFEKLKPPRLVSSTKVKQVAISRAPSMLVLHVNRSEYDAQLGIARKSNTRVEFSERIQFGKYASDQIEGGDETWYRLSSTVVHFGSHSFGHYIAYRRVDGSSWVRVSDGDVQPVSMDDVLSHGNVVLLFYEREPTVDFVAVEKDVIEEETKWPLYDVHDSDDMSDLYSVSSVESSIVLESATNGRIKIPINTGERECYVHDIRTNVL